MNPQAQTEAGSARGPRADLPDLLPARMLNEFAYCPRLFYLEWVQGEWRDSADTVEGRFKHRNVDREGGDLPQPGDEGQETIHVRSLHLSSERLGLTARIDVIEADGNVVTPVDYKRGKVPEAGPFEPERVQLCIHALILRDKGYQCDEGVVYYVDSRRRVSVPIVKELVERTTTLAAEARKVAAEGRIPPPLVDSPKCPRCSLVGICLPDEVNALREQPAAGEVRRLFPARDDALPVYVQEQGASVGKGDERLVIRTRDDQQEVRLLDVSQLCVFGNVSVTPPALRLLASRSIPVCHFSYGGWFEAVTVGMAHKNVELRRRQFALAGNRRASLAIARRIVSGKIRNSRTLLRRNHAEAPQAGLRELSRLAQQAEAARRREELLGIEGAAARVYFSRFPGMIKADAGLDFSFTDRNRRPPRDPVNAMLSFVYAVLVKDLLVQSYAVGFDPYLGFYHQPRYGRPALALDLAEEYRPIIADSVVIGAINNGEIQRGDFLTRGDACALTPGGRRKILAAYERRMDALIQHSVLRYAASYRRILEVQARLLARYVLGELPEYLPFRTR